jgi:toxin FitB
VFLVDTNVISLGAPSKQSASPSIVEWIDARSDELFVSVITICEIEDGIAKSRREGASRKAKDLDAWLETLLHLYSDRVLPLDVEVARLCGRMSDAARALGRPPGLADLIVGATALHHRLTVLTRNVKHFEPLGVKVTDPYVHLPR